MIVIGIRIENIKIGEDKVKRVEVVGDIDVDMTKIVKITKIARKKDTRTEIMTNIKVGIVDMIKMIMIGEMIIKRGKKIDVRVVKNTDVIEVAVAVVVEIVKAGQEDIHNIYLL